VEGNCTATASTPWGHGPVTYTFNPKYRSQVQLWLTRPWGKGTGVLSSDPGPSSCTACGAPTLGRHPGNAMGEASFVGVPATYLVAKRCLASGSIQGERSLWIEAGSTRFTSIYGWCP